MKKQIMLSNQQTRRIIILFCFLIILFVFKVNLDSILIDSPKLIAARVAKNNEYFINNNILQYSVYLVRVDEVHYRIETLSILSERSFGLKFNQTTPLLANYSCVVRIMQTEELIELEPEEQVTLSYDLTIKINFLLDLNSIRSYRDDSMGFELSRIVLAVIIKREFKQNSTIESFIKKNDVEDWPRKLRFPYSLINFQKPTIIYPNEPRLPAVGLCIQNTYNIQSTLLLSNWIDFQLSFGFAELRFYDATENASLTKFIKEKYKDDQRLTVISYEPTRIFEDLFKQYNESTCPKSIRNRFLKYTQRHFDKIMFRFADHITTNDCYTVLRYKYEFVAHFDLDEVIFPRGLENRNPSYECNSACNSKQINFYDYLNLLVESERKGRDRSKLGWIDFRRTTIFMPNGEPEVKLINDLKSLGNNKSVFVRQNDFKAFGYNFLIDKEDMGYVKSLIQAYNNLTKCPHTQLLLNTDSLDAIMIRYLYFVTKYEGIHKNYKKIHYYKNVNSIFTHWAVDYNNDTWSFIPSPYDGHSIHHFRFKTKDLDKTVNETIRLLNIDYGYFYFLVKQFSNFCNNKKS